MLFFVAIHGDWRIMIGQYARSESLFYYFRIEDQVPKNHLLRLIDRHIGSYGRGLMYARRFRSAEQCNMSTRIITIQDLRRQLLRSSAGYARRESIETPLNVQTKIPAEPTLFDMSGSRD